MCGSQRGDCRGAFSGVIGTAMVLLVLGMFGDTGTGCSGFRTLGGERVGKTGSSTLGAVSTLG
eukprot:scaffold248879_cov66-Cyclotella_meneghiniana.AAC.1